MITTRSIPLASRRTVVAGAVAALGLTVAAGPAFAQQPAAWPTKPI